MRRLILRPGAIGDCLLAFPAMQSLAGIYTEVWISSPVVPLVGFAQNVRALSETGIDRIAVGEVSLPGPMRQRLQAFDSIVSWYGANRPEFQDALRTAGVPCDFLAALPPADYPGHAGSFFAGQVNTPDVETRIEVRPIERRHRVVIHPFSGGTRKNWPLQNYRMLAQQLPCPVDWTAGPEEELAEAQRFDDLSGLANWLSGARLYIGNDSGITHLAAATGVPTLALFGPTDPCKWAPRGANVRVLRHEPLEALSPRTVAEMAIRLLG